MRTTEVDRHAVMANHGDATSLQNQTPSVDVRIVLFTVTDGQLRVALEQVDSCGSLPRGKPSPDESLDATATRILASRLRIPQSYLEQL